jgi:hypothetical protein
LLGWSHAEAEIAWLEPMRFADRWRVDHTEDTETLRRAGLHEAELSLLDAFESD